MTSKKRTLKFIFCTSLSTLEYIYWKERKKARLSVTAEPLKQFSQHHR